MTEQDFFTVPQVAEELQTNYQRVLYMIKTGKLPAEKVGRAFKIPLNYRELMDEIAQQPKEKKPRKKRVTRKGKRASLKEKPAREQKQKSVTGKLEDGQKLKASREEQLVEDYLINNLARAIQDLVQFQVSEMLGKKRR